MIQDVKAFSRKMKVELSYRGYSDAFRAQEHQIICCHQRKLVKRNGTHVPLLNVKGDVSLLSIRRSYAGFAENAVQTPLVVRVGRLQWYRLRLHPASDVVATASKNHRPDNETEDRKDRDSLVSASQTENRVFCEYLRANSAAQRQCRWMRHCIVVEVFSSR